MRFLSQAFTGGFGIFCIILGSTVPGLMCALAQGVSSATDGKAPHPPSSAHSPARQLTRLQTNERCLLRVDKFLWTSCLLLSGNTTLFSDIHGTITIAFKYFWCQRSRHTFTAEMQPSTLSGVQAHDPAVTGNSLWSQREIPASRRHPKHRQTGLTPQRELLPPDLLLLGLELRPGVFDCASGPFLVTPNADRTPSPCP